MAPRAAWVLVRAKKTSGSSSGVRGALVLASQQSGAPCGCGSRCLGTVSRMCARMSRMWGCARRGAEGGWWWWVVVWVLGRGDGGGEMDGAQCLRV